jgi:hypothetical protein
MKIHSLAAAALVALCGLAALPAQAVGRLADVTVIDRNSGATLPLYFHRGEYWVAGQPGARYAVQVRNRLGARVMAVTSVDGVNVLSGETAAFEQTGYVFGAWQSYQITGWRKSDSQVAAFEFSDAANSYAQRTGRPGHVGVIGVALFREKAPDFVPQPMPMQIPAPIHERSSNSSRDSGERLGARERQSSDASLAAPAERDAPASPAPSAKSQLGDLGSASGAAAEARAQHSPDGLLSRRHAEVSSPKLGTAHGQREASYVQNTHFERRSASPDEVVRIRYDSRDNLLAMGVIMPRPLPAPSPNPFPESSLGRYVPDPPVLR